MHPCVQPLLVWRLGCFFSAFDYLPAYCFCFDPIFLSFFFCSFNSRCFNEQDSGIPKQDLSPMSNLILVILKMQFQHIGYSEKYFAVWCCVLCRLDFNIPLNCKNFLLSNASLVRKSEAKPNTNIFNCVWCALDFGNINSIIGWTLRDQRDNSL